METNKYKRPYEYGFSDKNKNSFKLPKGHSKKIIRKISSIKGEPKWMLNIRLKAYEKFLTYELPNFGPDLSEINFDDIYYYAQPGSKLVESWDDVPKKIKNTFKKLGIDKNEQDWLAGLATQYDSEMIYASAKEELEKLGVLFTSTDQAIIKYPKITKKYFASLVNQDNNMFAALNTAFWSGGTFVYVPKGIHLERPLQSYFRINEKSSGQFERTLIIVEEGASVHYVEGCTAPTYTTDSLHAAVVEVFVAKQAKCKYTTIQNWSDNVLNLVTKSSIVKEAGSMEWVDGNLGSKLNMKYPSTILEGNYSKGNCLSIAIAIGKNIIQDAGAKMIHKGKNTQSTILSKSISGQGGVVNYRGLIYQDAKATNSKSKVECDTMILDEFSTSDTIPTNIVSNNSSSIEHEAVVSKISERQIYYLQSRGHTRNEAREMIVMGFVEPFAKEIPLEYASELNRLIKIEMEGNIG